MMRLDIGDIKSHTFQPQADIVSAVADIADASVGQLHVERQNRQHGRLAPDIFANMRIAGNVCLPRRNAINRCRKTGQARCRIGRSVQEGIRSVYLDFPAVRRCEGDLFCRAMGQKLDRQWTPLARYDDGGRGDLQRDRRHDGERLFEIEAALCQMPVKLRLQPDKGLSIATERPPCWFKSGESAASLASVTARILAPASDARR